MTSIYHLGWPGMELLPCIIVDQKSREMYHSSKPLPYSKSKLNTPENRYVEFARVLSLFPVDKQQEAMNTFMGISSDLCVRKFFMDNNQKAYISVDTLLVYVMVYPKCRAFLKARQQTIDYLAEWLDYPCLECGFIKRSGCLCSEDNPCDGEKTESIGYCTETIDRQVQTDPGGLMHPPALHPMTAQAQNMATRVQQPPMPPIAPTFLPGGSHAPVASVILTGTTSSVIPSPRVVNVVTSSSGASVPMTVLGENSSHPRAVVLPHSSSQVTGVPGTDPPDLIIKQTAQAVQRTLLRVPPIQAVAPLPPIKPKTRDVGIQTRANFDFTPRNRSRKRVTEDALTPAAKPTESSASSAIPTPGTDSPASNIIPNPHASTSTNVANPSFPSLPLAQLPSSAQPIKVSLWKLLDSDSSDDEDGAKKDKENEKPEDKKDEKQENDKMDVGESKSEEPKPSTSKEQKESEAGTSGDRSNYQNTFLDFLGKKASTSDNTVTNSQTGEKSVENGNVIASDNAKDAEIQKENVENVKFKEAHLSSTGETVVSALLVEEEKPSEKEKEEEEKKAVEPPREKTEQKEDSAVVETPEGKQAQAETDEKADKTEGIENKDDKKETDLKTEDKSDKPETESIKNNQQKGESAMDIDSEDRPLTIDLTEANKQNKENTEEKDSKTEKPEENTEPKATDEPSTSGTNTEKKAEEEKEEDKKKEERKEDKGQRKKWFHKFEYMPTKEQLYRCTFKRCGQCFDTRKGAELHNLCHGLFGQEDPTNLMCYQCEYRGPMSRWFDMVRHLKEKHDVHVTKEPLGCHFCAKTFENEESLLKHVDFHYMGRYKCIYCGSLGFTWKQMESHLETQCAQAGKREKNLGCPYCPLVFHIRNMRNAHMLAHTDKGLCCTFCKDNNVWESWTELRKHYQQKHSEKIRSALNPYHSRKSALQVKIQKNPECHVCDHECKTHEDYVYHMRKKHDFIPYVLSVCEVCEKTFKSQKMYDWHFKHTHGSEVKCPKCDFTARNDIQLKQHDQNQHQAKEYECVECGKEFQFYHQLRMHMAHHALHTIYNCNECGAEFKRQKELRAHVKKEHPKEDEKPMQKCPDCDYESFTKRALEQHIKRYHPKLAEEIAESETHALPAMPEHSYFNTKASPQNLNQPALVRMERPAPENSQPRAIPVPKRKHSSGQFNKSKKKKKGKKGYYYKRKSRPLLDENGAPILDEKQRQKLELREKVEKLRELVKETCVRTRTYEDNKDLKLIKRRKAEPVNIDPIPNTTTVESVDEPEPKRQRVSKYGRSISTKTYDNDDIYMPIPKRLPEYRDYSYKSQREKYRPGDGIAPPSTWIDEANTRYPYTDHCYFTIDAANTMTHSQEYEEMLKRSDSAGGIPSSLDDIDIGDSSYNAPVQLQQSQPMRSYRIGPYGTISRNPVDKYNYSRGRNTKQQMYSRRVSPKGRQGFMPLQPDTRMTHDIITIQAPNGAAAADPDDMRFDDIDNELIKEVAKDPLLQGIIDSMDPHSAPGLSQDSPSKSAYSQISQSRNAMPPSSLNLSNSVATVIPPITPPSTPNRGQNPATSGISSSVGLTPTKQSVIDLLLSKIELNDEQLNKLLEEQNTTEGQSDLANVGNLNPSMGDMSGQTSIANQSTGMNDQPTGEVLSLEQLASGNIASITKINPNETPSLAQVGVSNLGQTSDAVDNQLSSDNQMLQADNTAAIDQIPATIQTGDQIAAENVEPLETSQSFETTQGEASYSAGGVERQMSQQSEASEAVSCEQAAADGLGTTEDSAVAPAQGNEYVPVENEEVRLHDGSDTDSNPDIEGELIRNNIVPPSPLINSQRGSAGVQQYNNLATLAQAVESAEPMQYTGTQPEHTQILSVCGDTSQQVGYMQSTQETDMAVASIPMDSEQAQQSVQVHTVSSPAPEAATSAPLASQYRAITMSDGKGGTVRKVVRVLQRDGAASTAQVVSSQPVGAAIQGAIIGEPAVVNSPVPISSTVLTSGAQIITQQGVSTAQPAVVRRLSSTLSQPVQNQVVRRVVQIVSSQPQQQVQQGARIITTAPQPNRQVIRVASQPYVRPRGRPSSYGIRMPAQPRSRPVVIHRQTTPAGQIRLGTNVGQRIISASPSAPLATSNVIRISAPSNHTPVTLVSQQVQDQEEMQQ